MCKQNDKSITYIGNHFHTAVMFSLLICVTCISFYRATTFDRDITPYIHTFVFHSHHFVQRYGELKAFETEALEHQNLTNKLVFFGATNHGKENFSITEQVKYIEINC